MGWVFLGANVFWQILGDYIPDECVLIADVGLVEMRLGSGV